MSDVADYILVIDHNESDRRQLAEYLTQIGYYVQQVGTVHDASLLEADEPPSLVFVDLDNEHVRELPYIKSDRMMAPVVVVSEVGTSGDVVACLRAGASDFILKPIDDFHNVDKVIHGILDKIRLNKLNKRLHQELEERNSKLREGLNALRTDQKAGREIQLKMLPDSGKVIQGLEFDHCVKPSLYLSGDFLDYFNLDASRTIFYFADVSGHGASSAFVTVLLKNLTMRLKRNYKRGSSDELTCPARFLKRINQELNASNIGKHITVFAGLLDRRTSVLEYAIGGHFPVPILKEHGQAEYLEGRGVALGLFPDPEFEVYKRTLEPGFSITVFSDGILEVIAGKSLNDKEKLLLDVVCSEQRGIESLLSSLGLDNVDELPDDIAVLTVRDVANWGNQ